MSRTITASAQTQADSAAAKPFNVLHIERTGASDLYLSDEARVLTGSITTEPCITDWGQVSLPGTRVASQQSGAAFPLADYSVTVHLADSTLRGIFLGSNPPIHETCTLYQYWDDASLAWAADAVVLYEGTLGSIAGGSAQRFSDRDVTIQLRIIDRFKTLLDKTVGNAADRDIFGDVL